MEQEYAELSTLDQCKILAEKYLILKNEHEKTSQNLYEYKNELKLAIALQSEYQEEIKILQTENGVTDKKWEDKVQQIEEKHSQTQSSYLENIKSLENDLSEKNQEIVKLKNEIEVLKTQNLNNNELNADHEKLEEELMEIKKVNNGLLELLEECQANLEITQNKNTTLEKTISELHEELEILRDSLNTKKEELNEANNLIETLQADLMSCKSELESITNKPLDKDTRGNSLFAEVNDRRVQLQEDMNKMKAKYLAMKNHQSKYVKTIANLKKMYGELCMRLETEKKEKELDEEHIFDSYKLHIATLESLVEKYEEESKEKFEAIVTNTSPSEMQLFDNLMNNKRKEIETLREELKQKSLDLTISSREMARLRRELETYRFDNVKYQYETEALKNDVEVLKEELETMKTNSSIVKTLKDEEVDKENCDADKKKRRETIFKVEDTKRVQNDLKSTSNIFELSNTEKCASKAVRFSADTVSSLSERRRGGRVLSSKPVHFSSLPKKST